MMNFVSIDNRPEFFIDLLNSTYLNETFMYNVTNVSQSSNDAKEEKNETLEFVLMSLITVVLGLLILITIIGELAKASLNVKFIDFASLFFQEMFSLLLPS